MAFELDKPDWLAGQECHAMAWHSLRAATTAHTEATLFRMEQGREVGALARQLYPDGIIVTAHDGLSSAAVTESLIAGPSRSTLFEAAFVSGPWVARPDILTRDGATWHAIEVKSSFSDSTSLQEYIDDLAYTTMVLRRSGLPVAKASLLLLSRGYRQGQDASELFVLVDKTSEVDERIVEFERDLDAVVAALLADRAPDTALVSACRRCAFFAEKCYGASHAHTILELPGLNYKKLKQLSDTGIVDLSDLPPTFGLTDRQQRARDSIASGSVIVTEGLGAALSAIRWPCHYLDFETVSTVLPLYEGHGCHQQVLTQFSVHRLDTPLADPRHSAFLADAGHNEERAVAEALVGALGDTGSIMVYSAFEKTRINALRDSFPDLRAPLDALVSRLVDLNAIVASNVYHPNFRGSFSIKAVLPALVPDMSYADSAIADGQTAMALFARMAKGQIAGDAARLVRQQLLDYCSLDTYAMVRLHAALCALASPT